MTKQNDNNQQHQRIRVLLVSHASRLYGAERSLLMLAGGLDPQRFKPLVILPEEGPLRVMLDRAGIEVEVVRCPWWVRATGGGGKLTAILSFPIVLLREVLALKKLQSIIDRHEIDLVYTNTAVILGGSLAAHLSEKPHVWHVREILPGNPDLHSLLPLRFLHRQILKQSRTVLVNSEATAQPFRDHDTKCKLRVVANAVDPLPADTHIPSLPSIGLEQGDWVVAWLGALQPRKAPEVAIRTIALAKERIPNLKLLVMGSGRDDYTQRLRKLTRSLGLDQSVLFAGYRPDARHLMQHCKALLMTAPDEPFGRVVTEAMCDGIAVVAVGGGGVTELVNHGVTGLLSPPHDPTALAKQLVELHDNQDKAEAMVDQARQKAAEAWAPTRYINEIEAAITEAVRQG